jgi:hypothetical protein
MMLLVLLATTNNNGSWCRRYRGLDTSQFLMNVHHGVIDGGRKLLTMLGPQLQVLFLKAALLPVHHLLLQAGLRELDRHGCFDFCKGHFLTAATWKGGL